METKPRSKAKPLTRLLAIALSLMVSPVCGTGCSQSGMSVGAREETPESASDASASASASASAASSVPAYWLETGAFAVDLPRSAGDALRYSVTEDSTDIVADGLTVARLLVGDQGSALGEDERKHRMYRLATPDDPDAASMVFYYVRANGNTYAHRGDSSATDLGVERLAGMTDVELLACVKLFDGGSYVNSVAVLVEDDAPRGTAVDPAAGGATVELATTPLAVADAQTAAFWGIWSEASKSQEEAEDAAAVWRARGFDARVFFTTDWTNLNNEPWYAVSVGVYASEAEADAALSAVQSAGDPSAYVKYSGERQ